MASDGTYLETYKNIKTRRWSLIWINFEIFTWISRLVSYRRLRFALSWDQLISFLGKQISCRQGEWKSLAFSTVRETVRVYLNYVCFRFDQILLHHLHVHSRYYSDIRWNTRAFVATSHAYQYVEQRHPKNVDRLWENLAIQFINCCWPPHLEYVCELAFARLQ